MRYKLTLAAVWLTVQPWSAWAQEASAEGAAGLSGGDMTWALMKTVGGLAAVLGLMGILYWALRRFNPAQAVAGRAGRMRVLGRLSLGPRKQMVMVRVGPRVLLLGLGQDGVRLVESITDPAEVAQLSGEEADFARELQEARAGGEES